MSNRTLSAGDQIGRFEIRDKLGHGATGIVYLAHDPLLDIQVALKVLSPALRRDDALVRFQREVLLARRVSHPGICRLFDIHQQGETLFISMEYVPGPTLEEVLADRGVLPVRMACEVATGLCRALAAAHAADIIHRDLKPRNIIMGRTDQPTILDFGLATGLDLATITQAGARIGTIHYMSPEVIQGKPATARSDIYSLGVILYRCLTGRLPFPGRDLIEIKRAIDAGRAVPARMFSPEVPQGLERVLGRAMAAAPGERHASADQLRRAIRTEAGEPIDQGDEGSTDPWNGDIDSSIQEVLDDPRVAGSIAGGVRQAAILFSDMQAITAYFDRHGDQAGRDKIRRHNDLLVPVIEAQAGTVVKTLGDAIMATFDLANDAVAAAIEMQLVLQRHNREQTAPDEEIRVRIGVHHGQSIFENRDVFGDTVNVAARICTTAAADQILISAAAHESLTHCRAASSFHSRARLKGKQAPIELYQVRWRTDDDDPLAGTAAEAGPPLDSPSEVTRPDGVESPFAATAQDEPPAEGSGEEKRLAPLDGPTLIERPSGDGPTLVDRPGSDGPTLLESPGEAPTLIERRAEEADGEAEPADHPSEEPD